jgi:hypothetical protein
MREVMGVVVCACFSVLWACFVLANLLQIRAQRQRKKQAIKYYLSRMSAVHALGMFVDNLATLLAYQLQGEAFTVMMVFGTILLTLMTQVVFMMLSVMAYQALLTASTLKLVAVKKSGSSLKRQSSLKRRFVAINVGSCVWSTAVTVIMVVINKRWLVGLVYVMWAVSGCLLILCFWHCFSAISRSARATAKALGVKWVNNSLRKPVIATVMCLPIAVGLLSLGTLALLDRERVHIHMHIIIHIRIHTYKYTHIHTHTHAYTHTYIHTHRRTAGRVLRHTYRLMSCCMCWPAL